MYALVYKNDVVQISDTIFEVNPDFIWVYFDPVLQDVQAGWTYVNGIFIEPPPPPDFPPAITREFSTPDFNKTINAIILSKPRDAYVIYNYSATVVVLLPEGQSIKATLEYADNEEMTENKVIVCTAITGNAGVIGLIQENTLTVSGMIPAGKYRKVTFAVSGNADTPKILESGQEVILL